MKVREAVGVVVFLLMFCCLLVVNAFAEETTSIQLNRFNSYEQEENQSFLHDYFDINIVQSKDNEVISIDVKGDLNYERKIIDKTRVIYYFDNVMGAKVSKKPSSLKGIFFEKIDIVKLSTGRLQIVIDLYDYTFLKFEDDFTLSLKYKNSYLSYLDKIKVENEEARSNFFKSNKISYSEEFLDKIDIYDNGEVLFACYEVDEHVATFSIPGLVLVDEDGNSLYRASNLGTKYSIVFDSSLGNVNVDKIEIGDYLLENIHISKNSVKGTTMIVFESKAKLQYIRNVSEQNKGLELYISARDIITPDKIEEIEEPGAKEPDGGNTGQANDFDVPTTIDVTKIKDISLSFLQSSNSDEVLIDLNGVESYRVHRMTEPERIVIDLYGVYLESNIGQIQADLKYIDNVRYARFNETTARIVLDLKNPFEGSESYSPQNNYETSIKNGKLHVKVTDRLFTRYYYSNAHDRVYLLLMGDVLTNSEVYPDENKCYSDTYDSISNIYTITYSSSYDFNGVMQVNDAYVQYIDSKSQNGMTTLNIKLNDDNIVPMAVSRYIKTSSDYKFYHSTITFVKKKEQGHKLVVIDAGHGGVDPGTTAGNLYIDGLDEKDVNLDIAKRLEKLLEASSVDVYMTREDDSYVGLGERANVANKMDADLFLSIHNNAYYKSFNGTETYHFPVPEADKGVNCVEFATYLQNEMVKELKLYDRGVKTAKFTVLKYTDMPASLVEIGFLSNEEEAIKLNNPEFRQRAALALYRAIMKSLSMITGG